jgi:uncharacterized membrane protein
VSDGSGGMPDGPPLRVPRAVPTDHAFAWYREAMQLWRVSPAMFAALAGIAIAVEIVLSIVPVAGVLIAQLILPLVECGLLYASLAADRGDRPRLRHVLAIAGASRRAQVAVVLAGIIGFAAQALTASTFTDIDLLRPGSFDSRVTLGDLTAIVAAGVVVSLPFSFVAPIALFDDPGFAASFRASFAAFARNPVPLLVYAALSIGLFVFGIVTSGLGLLLALPWLAASSYASWKDVFAVSAQHAAPESRR